MNIDSFWDSARAGEIKFIWVDLYDNKECQDCLAIDAQQDPEGYTWQEWVEFGLPRSGHTACRGNCRCQLAPVPYVNFSPEFQAPEMGLFINIGEASPQMERIVKYINMLRNANYDLTSVTLLGLTMREQEEKLYELLVLIGLLGGEGK